MKNTDNIQKQKGQIRFRKPDQSWNLNSFWFFGLMKPWLTCIRMMGRGKYRKGKEQELTIQSMKHYVWNIVEAGV